MDETHQKSDLLLSLRKYREALKLAQESVAREPEWAAGYSQMARAHAGLGEVDAALTEAREGVRLDPCDAWKHTLLAVTLRVKGRRKDALAAVGEALRLDPNHLMAYEFQADLLSDCRRFAEALDAADAGLRLAAEDAGLLYQRCWALTSLGRRAEADACARAGRRQHPLQAEFHCLLGQFHDHRNAGGASAHVREWDLRQAEACFREAARLDPTSGCHRNRLKWFLRWQSLRRSNQKIEEYVGVFLLITVTLPLLVLLLYVIYMEILNPGIMS